MARVIADGVGEGLFADVDPTKVGAMVIEATIALASQRLEAESAVPVEEDARLVQSVFLAGIRRPAVTP